MRWGFIVTLGVLLALLLASVITTLQEIVLAVFIAAFISLGLDPALRFFQRRGLNRSMSILIVILLAVAVVIGVIWIVIPPVIAQAIALIQNFPAETLDITKSAWFVSLDQATGGAAANFVASISTTVSDPSFWASIGGGALRVGLSIANAVTLSIFVFVLIIYFIATIDSIKKGAYALVARSKRAHFELYAEKILASIGAYLSGMVILAVMNATFSVIMLTIVGVPYAILFGVIALFITLIPLVGTVITSTLMTIVALFVSPTAAIIVGISMLIYMQVEAYILTPKVMSKAVQIPGSVVLISALAGGTLLGLLGALVAIPFSAAVMLIIKSVVMPEREKR